MNPSQDRLKQTLIENGESPDDAESLAELSAFLDAVPSPAVNDQHRNQVLELVSAAMPKPRSPIQRVMEWYPLLLLRSQVRIIQREIWLASGIVTSLGVLVTLATAEPNLAVFSALAPIVAAISIAMLYDRKVQMMLEIEESTLASAWLLLLARLTLVYGFNLLLALIGSVILAVFRAEVLLLPLIGLWLAPMTFLSALAFFLSIVLNDTFGGSVFTLFLWIIHNIFHGRLNGDHVLYVLSLPGLSAPENRVWLMLTSGAVVAAALWILSVKERNLDQGEVA